MPDFVINDKPENLSPSASYKVLVETLTSGEYEKVELENLLANITVPLPVLIVKNRTTSFTPDTGSHMNYYIYDSVSNGNVTIESNSVTNIGEYIIFNNKNAGILTALEGVGVTINPNPSGVNAATAQGDNFGVIKIGASEYNFI